MVLSCNCASPSLFGSKVCENCNVYIAYMRECEANKEPFEIIINPDKYPLTVPFRYSTGLDYQNQIDRVNLQKIIEQNDEIIKLLKKLVEKTDP